MQADQHFRLPEPDDASRQHSARVARHIRDAIEAASESISFAEYMQLALYAPGLGYYVSGNRKFGEDGDFVTAPEVSPLFSRVLGNQVAEVLRQLDGGDVLELGAGSGSMAVELYARLRELGLSPRYRILEVSPELAERQRELVSERLPDEQHNFEWLSQLPDGLTGVIVANEVADALPVELFLRREDEVRQLRVVSSEGGFALADAPAPAMLADAVHEIERDIGQQLANGYRSEVSLGLPGWIADLGDSLEQGFVFLLDYGVGRREYFAPERSDGWLRCHFRHRVHNDPLILTGIQDLTAWVDFTALAKSAAAAGFSVAGYTTQAAFMAGGGIEQELHGLADLPESERFELLRQVRTLTLPGEMGEHFKCIGLARSIDIRPTGFAFSDRAHVL